MLDGDSRVGGIRIKNDGVRSTDFGLTVQAIEIGYSDAVIALQDNDAVITEFLSDTLAV